MVKLLTFIWSVVLLSSIVLVALADDNPPDIRFYTDVEQKGKRAACINTKKYNQCYRIEDHIASKGLSSLVNIEIDYFPTLNDYVKTFKIANFKTATDSGHAGWKQKPTDPAGCLFQ
ncbi:hypothetical protein BGX33_004330 [Mortierella sp. NVP41]|nr:hypothetical protein BGX33_004330 [Mortierella sp. NVP41]